MVNSKKNTSMSKSSNNKKAKAKSNGAKFGVPLWKRGKILLFVLTFATIGSYFLFGAYAATSPGLASKSPNSTWGDHMGVSLWPTRENFFRARALGVGWVGISWEMWNSPSTFDQSLIVYAHSIGLKVLETCQMQDRTYPISKIGEFATYCASWVDKGVDAIQIGNEWNNSDFWQPQPTGDYTKQAQFLDLTSAAIRNKSSTIPIMNAGWSPGGSPNAPYDAMLNVLNKSNGTFANNASAIATHPYAIDCDDVTHCGYPTHRDWNPFMNSKDVWYNSVSKGFNKPVWFTEMGGPSANGNNNWTGEAYTQTFQKNLYLQYIFGTAYLRSQGVPVEALFWHSIQDGQSSLSAKDYYYGLYDKNWNEKEAAKVVKDMSSKPW